MRNLALLGTASLLIALGASAALAMPTTEQILSRSANSAQASGDYQDAAMASAPLAANDWSVSTSTSASGGYHSPSQSMMGAASMGSGAHR